jgi:hypothetical protein
VAARAGKPVARKTLSGSDSDLISDLDEVFRDDVFPDEVSLDGEAVRHYFFGL